MANAYQSIAEIVEAEISTSAKTVALVLYHYQNRKTGLCKPAIATIADGAGLGVTATKRALAELKEYGFIEWESKKPKFQRMKVNHYNLLFSNWSESDHIDDHIADQSTDQSTDQSKSDHEQGEQGNKNTTSKKRKKHEYGEEYSIFYSKYPRKVSKKFGEESWNRLKAEGKLLSLEDMIRALEEYSIAHDWESREIGFLPHISTWLNEERFNEKVSQLSDDDRAMVDDVKNNAVDRFNAWMEEKRKMNNA